MAKPKAMVSSRLAKLPKWKAWCSCELERATLTPNQEIRMIAKPRKRFPPIATNMSEWRVSSSVIDWTMTVK